MGYQELGVKCKEVALAVLHNILVKVRGPSRLVSQNIETMSNRKRWRRHVAGISKRRGTVSMT